MGIIGHKYSAGTDHRRFFIRRIISAGRWDFLFSPDGKIFCGSGISQAKEFQTDLVAAIYELPRRY